MRIGVISDTHGYADRVALAMENFFADADLILHAGDVLNHGARNPNFRGDDYNPQKLVKLINGSKIPFVICREESARVTPLLQPCILQVKNFFLSTLHNLNAGLFP